MKRISIQQPIIDAIDETDPSLSRFQSQMIKWAKYIEKEIGSANAYKFKSVTFTLDGCTFTLPDDCYHAAMILNGDYSEQCNARYLTIDWTNVRQDPRTDEYSDWLWRPAEAMYTNPFLWEEVAGEIQMINDFTDTEMTLIYQYIETDDRGFWIINESHVEAIKRYIKFKIAQKFNWKIFKSDKMLRSGHVQFVAELKHDYNIAIRNARAEDGKVTPLERSKY